MMDKQQEKEVKKMKRKNYMKKIVTVLAVATMLMSSLSACGKTEDTTTDKPAAEASVETEQTSEAAGTETVAETEAVAATEDNRLEDDMTKVYTLIDAYNDLLSQHKYAEDLLQADVESLDDAELGNLGLTTADGNEIQTLGGYYCVLSKYYFDYVNNGIKYGDGYSDFNELSTQISNEDEIVNVYGTSSGDTNTSIMLEAVRVLPFLASCEAVHGTDLVETTEYVMGDYTSAYAIPLDCDGNTGLTAVFDADGNLMNICSSDDFDQYISSFPNGASE